MCEEARCPNIGQCWGGDKGDATATIMVRLSPSKHFRIKRQFQLIQVLGALLLVDG